jgi:hypothetical protein
MSKLTYAELEEIGNVALQLTAEVPYETCSKLFTHDSWLDLVMTIREVSPAAYAALVRDLVKEKQ